LFVAGEILALRLLTVHNLWLYGAIMREARQAICESRYDAWMRTELDALAASEAG
jgi:queuine tRNA-ribosyltransferase